jgi:hypothetical protein
LPIELQPHMPRLSPCQAQALTFRHHIESFLDRDPAHKVQVDWSPGHLDIPGNEKADMLANTAARTRPRHTHRTLIHAKSRTKIQAREAWSRYASHSRFSAEGFRPADGFAPKWKPHKHFKDTPREIYGRMIQCRTGHAFLGEYYRRFNILVDDTYCPCGEPSQTRKHVLYDCPQYEEHRHLLNIKDKLPAIEVLLGSEEGLEALAAFLEASGAFTKTVRPRGKYTVPTWEDYIAPRDGGEDEELMEEEDGCGEEDAKDEDEEEARRLHEEQEARWAIPADGEEEGED